MRAKLSVNINKLALLRNSRKGNYPDLLKYALDCEEFGCEGITVHPRPDERHIRYSDIPMLKSHISSELNIEGNPSPKFLELVLANLPAQCTLVPDDPTALTSDQGWDTIKHKSFLKEVCDTLRSSGIRSSIFLDPEIKMLEGAAEVGADRIELYTGEFAKYWGRPGARGAEELEKHAKVAVLAANYNIGINAGHDLNLDNLNIYASNLPNLLEVSVGHALTIDSIYFGLKNAISMYKKQLQTK